MVLPLIGMAGALQLVREGWVHPRPLVGTLGTGKKFGVCKSKRTNFQHNLMISLSIDIIHHNFLPVWIPQNPPNTTPDKIFYKVSSSLPKLEPSPTREWNSCLIESHINFLHHSLQMISWKPSKILIEHPKGSNTQNIYSPDDFGCLPSSLKDDLYHQSIIMKREIWRDHIREKPGLNLQFKTL